jgi:hypothetical protein
MTKPHNRTSKARKGFRKLKGRTAQRLGQR